MREREPLDQKCITIQVDVYYPRVHPRIKVRQVALPVSPCVLWINQGNGALWMIESSHRHHHLKKEEEKVRLPSSQGL